MHVFTDAQGAIKRQRPGTSAPHDVALPAGVFALTPRVRPDAILFQAQRKMPMVGAWNKNLLWLVGENRVVILGIEQSGSAPTLAAGSGTGITGSAIGVYTFAQYINGRLIHESNPSDASNTVVLANDDRDWSGLPTTHDNPRVTHKRLYISMDGGDYQFVAAVPLASATYTDSVATADLPDPDPLLFRRGVPPYSKLIGNYHRRAWYSNGTNEFWFSEIDEPESVPATNSLKTQDARNITVFRALTDQLVVATRKSVQDVQGYSAEDYQMRIVSQHIGGISHHASIIVNDKLWLLSQDGYYRYSQAGFQYLMPQLRTYFTQAYLADADTYQDSIAALDLYGHVLRLLIPGTSAFYYIGHFLPSETEFGGGGGLPYWTFDRRGRQDSTVGVLTNNNLRDESYTGSCDGYIRKDNIEDDGDDDGDSYQKTMTVAGRHFFMGDQSGDDQMAHRFQYADMYVKAEESAWSANFYTGDDDAYSAAAPRHSIPIPASRVTKGSKTAVAKTSHRIKLENCSGKGLTAVLVAVAPVRVQYRGLGLEFEGTGAQTRDQAAT